MFRRALLALSLLALVTAGPTGCGGTSDPVETYNVAYTIEMIGASCSSLQYDPGNGVLVTVNNPANAWNKQLTGLLTGSTVEIKATCTAAVGAPLSVVTVTQLGAGSVHGIVVDSVTTQTVFTGTVVACDKKTLQPLPTTP